jgi:hypothetical protein
LEEVFRAGAPLRKVIACGSPLSTAPSRILALLGGMHSLAAERLAKYLGVGPSSPNMNTWYHLCLSRNHAHMAEQLSHII